MMQYILRIQNYEASFAGARVNKRRKEQFINEGVIEIMRSIIHNP